MELQKGYALALCLAHKTGHIHSLYLSISIYINGLGMHFQSLY